MVLEILRKARLTPLATSQDTKDTTPPAEIAA
jgi:hypothetical protein